MSKSLNFIHTQPLIELIMDMVETARNNGGKTVVQYLHNEQSGRKCMVAIHEGEDPEHMHYRGPGLQIHDGNMASFLLAIQERLELTISGPPNIS